VQAAYLTVSDGELVEIKAGRSLDIPNIFSLIDAHIKMYASAVVGDRRCGFLKFCNYEGVSYDTSGYYSATFTASQTVDWDIDGYDGTMYGCTHMRPNYLGVYPNGIIIQDEDYLRWYISGGKAGDRFQVFARFRWLNEILNVPPAYEQTTKWAGRPAGRIRT